MRKASCAKLRCPYCWSTIFCRLRIQSDRKTQWRPQETSSTPNMPPCLARSVTIASITPIPVASTTLEAHNLSGRLNTRGCHSKICAHFGDNLRIRHSIFGFDRHHSHIKLRSCHALMQFTFGFAGTEQDKVIEMAQHRYYLVIVNTQMPGECSLTTIVGRHLSGLEAPIERRVAGALEMLLDVGVD